MWYSRPDGCSDDNAAAGKGERKHGTADLYRPLRFAVENIPTIENDCIRLGVNLGLGGAVTSLCRKGGPNLINS